MTASVASLVGLRVRLGRRTVLDGIDLEVGAGECVWLRGANGAGKSTLLRVLAALELRYEGEVRACGRTPQAARTEVAFVPPYDLVWATMTATSQLRQVVNVAGRTEEWAPASAIVHRVLGEFGLLQGVWLSSGQRRLLTLASVLALPAELVLLDEPLGSLDGDHVLLVTEAMRELTRLGAGVLVASHEPIAAATRVVRLESGRLAVDT